VIVKTLSGLTLLDEPHGGVFAGRNFLICGRSGTGKTAAGMHFIRQGLQQEERCLLLSTMQASDIAILAESYGFSFAADIEQGNLILLEYEFFAPGRQTFRDALPAEGFGQLQELIQANSITRVVLDTVLPWVSVPSTEKLSEHIFSFVRSFDRMNVTTLMTLPKPVSPMAFRLKKTIEEVTPISVLLSTTEDQQALRWQTVKYLGVKQTPGPVLYQLSPTTGITPVEEMEDEPVAAPEAVSARPEPESVQPAALQKVRFANKIQAAPTRSSSVASHPTGHQPPVPKGPARLSSVWKPTLTSSPPR